MNKTKGFLSLLLAGFLFGIFGVLVRILNSELSNYQQIFFRSVVGLILASLIIYILKRKISFKNISLINLFFFAISLPLSIIFYTLAILKTKIMLAVATLFLGSILFSLISGVLFFKEKITVKKILAILTSILALYYFTIPFSLTNINIGLIFGILSGFADALSNSFKKHLGGKADRFLLIAVQMVGTMAVSFILMSYTKTLTLPQISPYIFIIGLLFGLGLLVNNYLMLIGFGNFDLNLGTIILSSELLFASIFGYLFYKEIPTVNEVIGSGLIAFSVIIAHLNFKKNN
ncbi:MAG: DMT family transporter [Patescibacteria group bacterium]|jgi:drug/metabolite transporter (DMT)-like permease